MRLLAKRAVAGAVGLTVAAALPLSLATPAAAAPTPSGSATVTPASSSNSNNPFTISLPAGAACPGDSANDGWRITSYMVARSVDPATITFDSSGPIGNQYGSPQSTFRQPLYDTTGSPYVAGQTAAATPPPGPGPIVGLPSFSFNAFTDLPSGFGIPPGEYNIGIACILPVPGATPIDRFWNQTITVTTNNADPGPADISWVVGTVPGTPTIVATPGNQTCSVAVTPAASGGTPTSYTATITGPGAPAPITQATSPIVFNGLTNNSSYSITVTATNLAGTSSASAPAACTPVSGPRTNVTGLTATPGAPGSGTVALNWTPPAPNSPAATPTGYAVSWTGAESGSATVPFGTNTYSVTGLDAGSYTFTVTATYADAPTSGTPAATATTSVAPSSVIYQDINVNRPVGALVLTQVCASNGTIPADPTVTTGFPTGVPAVPAVNGSLVGAPTGGGLAPTLASDDDDPLTPRGATDPNRSEYPYPTDANGVPNPTYPTHCGLDLGIARFVTVGAGAGQYFAVSGVLNQVTVVDTRDDDLGWTVTGTMGAFTANGGSDSFSGSQLGWDPQVTDQTGAFTDSLGNTYDQTVTEGATVLPNSVPASTGLAGGRTLAQGTAGSGLGTAILDARLKLLIPVTADAGDYDGTLSLSAV